MIKRKRATRKRRALLLSASRKSHPQGSGISAHGLRKAIETGHITPAFQPLLDLRSRTIVGFEVLARWTDPVLGAVSPAEFIPLAEREGLLLAMTEHLLREACLAAQAWPGELTLAINIAPCMLRETCFISTLLRAVEPSGFPLARLEVELTEQAFVGPIQTVKARVAELKALGIRLVLDDFGTDHAGLNRLLELPFDKIKIDGSFVRSLDNEGAGRKIVASIVSLGLSLGIATVTEGIEEQSQADMLIRLGCAVGQGWLYGRAVPAEQVPALLSANRAARPFVPQPPQGCLFPEYLSASQRLTRLESIFHAAPVGLCFLDLSFRYITVNQYLARMYRIPAEQFIGRTVREVLPGPADQILAHLERVLATEELMESEIVVDAAMHGTGPRLGHELVYLRTAQPVRDEAGQIIGFSVALVDVTERKRSEAALRRSEECLRSTLDQLQRPVTVSLQSRFLN